MTIELIAISNYLIGMLIGLIIYPLARYIATTPKKK